MQPFDAHVNLLIIQHPNERRKYCGTAKIVTKAIRNSTLLRGVEFEPADILSALRGQKAYLLYPGKDAEDCAAVCLDDSCTVIAIDGTWDEAQKVLYRNPVLKSFPKLSFTAPLRSTYRIRRQPKMHCLSTLESIAHFLQRNAAARNLNGKSLQYAGLLDAFDRMVEQQLSYWPSASRNSLSEQLRS